MNSKRPAIRSSSLLIFLLAYAAASLFHYSHNAEFLSEYPSMPSWSTRAYVYTAWLGVSAIGLVGLLLARSRYQFLGLIVLAVYGLPGFDGLGHYAIAPLSAHTSVTNLTVWLEVVTAPPGVLTASTRFVAAARAGVTPVKLLPFAATLTPVRLTPPMEAVVAFVAVPNPAPVTVIV